MRCSEKGARIVKKVYTDAEMKLIMLGSSDDIITSSSTEPDPTEPGFDQGNVYE